jgi:hypothetical protein
MRRTLTLITAVLVTVVVAPSAEARPRIQTPNSDWHSILRYLEAHHLPLSGVVNTTAAARQRFELTYVHSDGHAIFRYLRHRQLPLRGIVKSGAAPAQQAAAARPALATSSGFAWTDAAIGAAAAVAGTLLLVGGWATIRRRMLPVPRAEG